jgi:hypothetical protein
VDRKRSLNTGGEQMQLAIGSHGWQELRLFSSGVNSDVNGRGGSTGRLVFPGLTAEGCGLERVGNKGSEDLWGGM